MKILKKVSKEYVTTFSYDFKQVIKTYNENTIVVIIKELGKDHPISISYPDYSIYAFHYTMAFDLDVAGSNLPSKMFDAKGYPVAFYSDRFPVIDKDKIPKSVYRKVQGDIWVDDGSAWYVFICKTGKKYKIIPDPYLEPESELFGRSLKDFPAIKKMNF